MATLVLKLLDFIRLDEEKAVAPLRQAQTPPPASGSSQLTYGPTYSSRPLPAEYRRFFERTDTRYQYTNPAVPFFWQQEILSRQLPVRHLFSSSPAEAINSIISDAIKRSGNGYQYAGVNFYNYFALDGEEKDLLLLLKQWEPYVAPYRGTFDPLKQPLEVMYIKGEPAQIIPLNDVNTPATKSSSVAPELPQPQGSSDSLSLFGGLVQPVLLRQIKTTTTPLLQRFWSDLNLTPLLESHPAAFNSANQAGAGTTIHEVENAWGVDAKEPDLFALPAAKIQVKFGVNPLNAPFTDFVRWHGASVLKILLAAHGDAPDQVRGIAPLANALLYACPPTQGNVDNTDDVLLNVLYLALHQPGDVLLLERMLKRPPTYDSLLPQFTGDFNYPVEVDQAVFDLISLATHTFGLLVVEPAGNQRANSIEVGGVSINLDDYNAKPYQQINAAQINENSLFSKESSANKALWDFYTQRVHPINRTLKFDLTNDSGAIMVGAATKSGAGWKRISNSGSRIDVYAPGDRIPVGSTAKPFYGTSGASALIAGSVSLLQQLRRSAGRAKWVSNIIRPRFRLFLPAPTVPPTLPVNLPDINAMAT